MARYIDENVILNIIKSNSLLNQKQINELKLLKAKLKKNLIEIIINEGFINNDLMIEILYKNKILPLVNSNIKIINYQDTEKYLTHGYFIFKDIQNNKSIAINDLKSLSILKNVKLPIVLIRKTNFYQALELNFAHLNTIKAKYFREFSTQDIIAKNVNYIGKITIFSTIFLLMCIYFPNIFHILNNLAYFIQNMLKTVLFGGAIFLNSKYQVNKNNNIEQEPDHIYTILVPLYKEIGKLKAIITNILALNYPKNKLDVKIIIEADDYLMIKEIALYNLPSFFHIIYVPVSFPRTKPKALNYALEYCRGEYLVVYDAEDIPDPDQLLKSLNAFKKLPPEYICLQAKLNFYNKDENLLTKMFNIEYSLWFEYILKGLSLFNLPVTLGGTSNHFKTDILRKIGGWDSYNVTEDAELGIRIYNNGYKVYIIDSYTWEESPISLGNWLNQRARWIKGFLQTFFVFQMQKNKKITLKQIITIYIFIGLSTYSFLGVPFIIVTIIINQNLIIKYLWLINSYFISIYLYGSTFYILNTSWKTKKVKFIDIIALILWPFYFLLHTIASYKAIWEIIFRPFKWNKTKHGVSIQNFEREKM